MRYGYAASMPVDRAALAAGAIRLASDVSFLVAPLRANRFWGDPDEPAPTARLLLRSMGDALIGGMLVSRPGGYAASTAGATTDLKQGSGGLTMALHEGSCCHGPGPHDLWPPEPAAKQRRD